MAEMIKGTLLVPLNGGNYATWKLQCRMALMKEGLWSYVDGTADVPNVQTDPEKYRVYVNKRDKALATIVLSVSPEFLYIVGDALDPVTVWNKLSNQFQRKGWANKLALRRKLYNTRLENGDSVQSHIKRMTEIFSELAIIGDPVKEEDQTIAILASLPSSYNILVTALEAHETVPNLEVVIERLHHEEMKINSKSDNSEMHALYSKNRSKVRCFHCNMPGHVKRKCPLLKQQNSDKSGRYQKETKTDGRNHPRGQCFKSDLADNSDSDCSGLIINQGYIAHEPGCWIIDSGATAHMAYDRSLFTSLKNVEIPKLVTVGDGNELKVEGIGEINLNVEIPGMQNATCKLHNVLFIPKLSQNLISVSAAAERGVNANFSKNHCSFFNKEKCVASATRKGNLYYLDCSTEKSFHASSNAHDMLWHRRLGHMSLGNLRKLSNGSNIHGIQGEITNIDFCEDCTMGKNHRKPFPNRPTSLKDTPLELVHSDLCGKMNSKSLSGGEYFLTFIDDATRYCWIYILKNKSEVCDIFKNWKIMVENQTGHRLKILRTDGGGEYTSKIFEDYLTSEGVLHHKTVPHTPEQNGLSERMNRTLTESVRSMLSDCSLPAEFWAEAVSTATYLRNRSPLKCLQNKSAFEALFKKAPDVSHIRVFGCQAYAHINKSERKKLDMKSKQCLLMGYGEGVKGYRLYDPEKKKIFFSRDVIFNEAKSSQVCLPEDDRHSPSSLQDEMPSTSEQKKEKSSPKSLPVAPDFKEKEDQESIPSLRRSSRERKPTDFYGEWTFLASEKVPSTVEEALSSPESGNWKDAMNKEMSSLIKNNVWTLNELPEGKNPVKSKWIFRKKNNPNSKLTVFKARLVAAGYSQKYGTDYEETFSPVVRFETVRTLLSFAVEHNFHLKHVDVCTAFLNGDLDKEVYMEQPPGYIQNGSEDLYCKLSKSIYGLKQAPRCWNQALHAHLISMGFVQSQFDPCFYTFFDDEPCFLLVYVDDIIIACKDASFIEGIKLELFNKFEMKDLGNLEYFLGIEIVHNPSTGSLWIGQSHYIEDVLAKFGMADSKPVKTPAEVVATNPESPLFDKTKYQQAIGSLLYLSIKTRPDIAFAVGRAARSCNNPTLDDWSSVKRILRYLRGTPKLGLLYSRSKSEVCVGYSDADWAGDKSTRKSTSGYSFLKNGSAVSWCSKRQPCVALSTAEAEYIALSSSAQEAIWLTNILRDFNYQDDSPITIYEDNISAIHIAENAQLSNRTKHIDIRFNFIKDCIFNNKITVKYCPTDHMFADILTKPLAYDRFVYLRNALGIKSI